MSEVKGTGKCGICHQDMQDLRTGAFTGPVRHYQGHQLAHQACYDRDQRFRNSFEGKLAAARQAVEQAETRKRAADTDLEVAKLTLAGLEKQQAAAQEIKEEDASPALQVIKTPDGESHYWVGDQEVTKAEYLGLVVMSDKTT
jgi:hypothetical protein